MKEINRIKKNINGEIPRKKFDILRVTDIDNPEEVLENFKTAIIAILENKNIDSESKEWESLIPKKMVDIVNRLEDDDYKFDDLVFPLHSIVEAVKDKDLKEWNWYSSKLVDRGFEIYFEGTFRGRFTWFVRFQNIPASKLSIERDGVIYPVLVLRDIFTHKNWD